MIDKPRWRENAPFWSVHVAAAIGAFAVGWSWTACAWLVATYAVRMFAISRSIIDAHGGRLWPEARYTIVPDAGHSAMEPGTRAALVQGMERFKELG